MTSITLVWNSEIISEEALENWVDYLAEKKILNHECERILINNQEYLNHNEVMQLLEFHRKLEVKKKDQI